ncbi:hypothetical protein HN709_00835 [Candidatus Peregrinibacteria bacterium]|jgi:hypothetical protein|nr:hypothetical protein [Candidatus Peregrinibacteria bacterium]
MENKFLIDLGIKYGLDSPQTSKIVDLVYQCGLHDLNSREAQRIAGFICEMDLVDKPTEEVIEEMKRKGFIS